MAHASFGVVEEIGACCLDGVSAVLPEQAVEAIDADHERRNLSSDVAERLVRNADLVGNDAEDFAVFNTALDELDHRQPQTFEIDFANPTRNSTRSDAT